jgi:microcystin-dependent protein
MPRSAAGAYTAPGGTAAVSGQSISSAAYNTLETDIGSEITNSLDRLGRGGMQANLGMGGNKITGLATGTAPGDATTVGQLANIIPAGAMLDYAAAVAPVGFLLCDGAAVLRASYAALFTAIGTVWGAGDGSTTFNVPDFRGRTSIGVGTGTGLSTRSLAATGGEEAHVLSLAELASHGHTDAGHTHTDAGHAHGPLTETYFLTTNGAGSGLQGGSNLGYQQRTLTASASAAIQSAAANIQANGGGGSHNNMQPWIAATKIIKT